MFFKSKPFYQKYSQKQVKYVTNFITAFCATITVTANISAFVICFLLRAAIYILIYRLFCGMIITEKLHGVNNMTSSAKYWAWLTIGLSPCNRKKWLLLRDYIFPEAIYDAIMQGETPDLSSLQLRSLRTTSLSQAEYLLEDCLDRGINVYCPDDDGYPKSLLEIDNPPSLLFSYGKTETTSFSPSVAIVGAREADEYAIKATMNIASELARRGVTIISGFARGIDTAAHRSALSAGSQTVAVLGCGLEYDYPRHSTAFKERIAENGAVISEFFPFAHPAPENFKIRNRIVAGLSDCIAVIQAGGRSGTLNTASHALSQGKDVFVLPPHDIFSGSYSGNVGLLRDGAAPIYSENDILHAMTAQS